MTFSSHPCGIKFQLFKLIYKVSYDRPCCLSTLISSFKEKIIPQINTTLVSMKGKDLSTLLLKQNITKQTHTEVFKNILLLVVSSVSLIRTLAIPLHRIFSCLPCLQGSSYHQLTKPTPLFSV